MINATIEGVANAIEQARETTPLAPSITNFVTIDFVANAQLAVGGSAAMVYLADEAIAIAQTCQGFYINLGTMLPSHEETMVEAAKELHRIGRPWVVDPVGIGLGAIRTRILMQMKECKPTIIRCNASEAIALARMWDLDSGKTEANVRGVDSTDSVDDAQTAALSLAAFTGGAVTISGEIDLVTDGTRIAHVSGGSELFTQITGSGCALGGVASVYAGVADPFTAALTAAAAFKLAGDRAARASDAPARFKVAFLDELYHLNGDDAAECDIRISEA